MAASGTQIFLSGTGNTYSGGTTINSGAQLQFGNPAGTGSLSIPGNVTDNGTLNIKLNTANYSYSGVISGTGSLQVNGTNTLTLTGANSYSGQTTVQSGTLLIGAANTLPSATALSIGAATVSIANDQIIDHFAGNMNSAVITITGGKTLTISPAGATSSTYNGTISDNGGGILVTTGNSGATTVLKNSSTFTAGTTVHSGTLELDNSSGSGLGTGPVTIDSGAQLVGKGNTFAGFTGTLSLSGTMRPSGTLAAGATTINPGARYTWLLVDTAGAAGTTYGLLNVTGSLTLNATALSPFVIAPATFVVGVGPGNASNFDTTQNYSITLATSTLGLAGFNASAFAFDMSGFHNAYTGTWAVAVSGNNLLLNYTGAAAIPEPAVSALFVGLSGLGVVRWRKRSRASLG